MLLVVLLFAAPLLWLAAPLLVYIVPMLLLGLGMSALASRMRS